MKKIFLLGAMVCALGMMTACKSRTKVVSKLDFQHIKEFIPVESMEYYADSINGYATFSAENNIVVIPEEINKEQYNKLITYKYTVQPVVVDTGSALYAELYARGLQNSIRYYRVHDLLEAEDEMFEERRSDYRYNIYIRHYPATRQYEYALWAPLTYESFMMTEDGIIDSTFMLSEYSTYGTNGIYVGQEGHDCDFHGDLWFYWYDEQRHHMVPLCHYVDYRLSEDGVEQGFDICWISDNELLVAAVSNGNSEWGWVGGYKPTTLAPHGTPVYYKLTITKR